MTYWEKVKRDVEDCITQRCGPKFALFWCFLEVLQLYGFYFAMIAYYILCANELDGFRFINSTAKRVYQAFLIMHMTFTFLPQFLFIVGKINYYFFSDYEATEPISCFNKFTLCLFTFFQLYFLRVTIGPIIWMDPSGAEDQKGSFSCSRAANILPLIMLICLLCINNDGLEVAPSFISSGGEIMKWLPLGMCSGQIPFNIISIIIIFPE